MENNTDGNDRGVFWDLHVPSNMNSLPRSLGNQRVQQQLGQVSYCLIYSSYNSHIL